MRKIITFLGIRPIPAKYRFGETIVVADVFPQAIMKHEPLDLMLICATEEAFAACGSCLDAMDKARVRRLVIPPGRNSEEMWTIFNTIVTAVEEGDEIVFDITHGLRSIPFLVFLCTAYLKSARDIQIKQILYGAPEQKDALGIAPVLDLSEFALLLDWFAAGTLFTQTGDSSRLVELMNEQRKPVMAACGANEVRISELSKLWAVSHSWEKVSNCLQFAQADQLRGRVAEMNAAAERARPFFGQANQTRPFEILMDPVNQAYSPLASSGETFKDSLAHERKLIRWFIERKHYMQAATLMREHLVNLVMIQCGSDKLNNPEERSKFEKAINVYIHAKYDNEIRRVDTQLPVISALPDAFKGLWSKIIELRNDINHAGMNKQPGSAENLINRLEDVAGELEEIKV